MNYLIDKQNLVIKFDEDLIMSDNLKQTLVETIKLNCEIDSLTVNGSDTVLYEETFNKVIEDNDNINVSK